MSLIPALWLNLQAIKVQLKLVAVLVRTAGETAFIDGVKASDRCNESVVTTAHHLFIDNHLLRELNGCLSVTRHTTYVTAAVDGTEHRAVINIVSMIAVGYSIECYPRHQIHGHTIHIGGKDIFVCQIHRVEGTGVTIILVFIYVLELLLKSAQYAFTQSLSFISLDHVGTVIA